MRCLDKNERRNVTLANAAVGRVMSDAGRVALNSCRSVGGIETKLDRDERPLSVEVGDSLEVGW